MIIANEFVGTDLRVHSVILSVSEESLGSTFCLCGIVVFSENTCMRFFGQSPQNDKEEALDSFCRDGLKCPSEIEKHCFPICAAVL